MNTTARNNDRIQQASNTVQSFLNRAGFVFLIVMMTFVLSNLTAEAAEREHSKMGHDHGDMHKDMDQKVDMSYDAPKEFKTQLDDVYQAYFHTQFALSHDNVTEAKKGAEHLQHTLSGVDMKLLTGDAHMAWMKELDVIKTNGALIVGAGDITAARKAFKHVSHSLINVTKMFGASGKSSVYRFNCPMVENTGADWLQNKKDLENPYFGSSMFKCGGLVETFENTH